MADSTITEHDAIQHYLKINGFLLTVLPVAEMPSSLMTSVRAADPAVDGQDALLMFANAGQNFWTQMKLAHSELPNSQVPFNPVDSYSQQLVTKFINTFISGDYELLYPSQLPIPLIELGKHAGWSHNSPLGLTLHENYGPWYAFRAVVRVATSLLPSSLQGYTKQRFNGAAGASATPCDTCVAKPCVSTCPAGAVSATEVFNLVACYEHRRTHGSSCESDCPARRACPVGAEFQYEKEQLGYHMRHSLASANEYSDTL